MTGVQTCALPISAQDLGYRFPTDRAHLLALSTDISRTGYWATVSGVVAASEELGADLSIHVLSGGSQRRREILSRALDGRVDGVVLLEFDSVSVAALEDLPVAIAGAVWVPGTRSRLGPGRTTMPGP